jgi:RNA polymerase sigma factor (sigma-70 family)
MRFALRIAGGMASVARDCDAGDLEGAALLELCRSAEAWEPDRGTRFTQYAGPRIEGAVKNAIRSTRAGRLKVHHTAEFTVADPGPEPWVSVDSAEAFECLIAAAPERCRDVLRLTFLAGYTQAEIAKGLGCSQPYVNRLLRDALLALAGDALLPFRPGEPSRPARPARRA